MTYYTKAAITKDDFERLIKGLELSKEDYGAIYFPNKREVMVATSDNRLPGILLYLYEGQKSDAAAWLGLVKSIRHGDNIGGGSRFSGTEIEL